MLDADQILGGCLALFIISLATFTATAGCFYCASKEALERRKSLLNRVLVVSAAVGVSSAGVAFYLIHR